MGLCVCSALPDSDLLATTTYPSDIAVTRSYEPNRNLLTAIENKVGTTTVGTTTVSKYEYTNDAFGRRTARAHSGTAFTAADTVTYAYNDRSEVISAVAAVDPAYDFAYTYDPIGNRETYNVGGAVPAATSYTTNQLNQYTAIQTDGATVTPTYDADGNITRLVVPPSGGSGWDLTWNGENRLLKIENQQSKIENVYDYMGRRVRKEVYSWDDQAENWTLTTEHLFLYDGWNLILELECGAGVPPAIARSYTWGLDLSGSLQGAGGVGGLLSVHDPGGEGGTYFAAYDANGNISEYLDTTGAVSAHYEYGPFGNTLLATGPAAANFPHRFSTKYLDEHTELYYYGYRYYSPELGRWINRDPINERGGVNLYSFVTNNPIARLDPSGLTVVDAPIEIGNCPSPTYECGPWSVVSKESLPWEPIPGTEQQVPGPIELFHVHSVCHSIFCVATCRWRQRKDTTVRKKQLSLVTVTRECTLTVWVEECGVCLPISTTELETIKKTVTVEAEFLQKREWLHATTTVAYFEFFGVPGYVAQLCLQKGPPPDWFIGGPWGPTDF